MAGKSGKWAQQEPKTAQMGYIGTLIAVEAPTSYSSESSNQVQPWTGQESNSYQKTSKNSIVDKQTGNYMRTTFKESCSTGDSLKERSTGRYGYKDEYKTTSTTRVGDKTGYYEYQREDRFRRVNYEATREETATQGTNTTLKSIWNSFPPLWLLVDSTDMELVTTY